MDLDIIEDADVDERAVLLISGSVDLDSREKLLIAGRESLGRDDIDGLILDLAGVTFMDSTGIGAFVELSRDAEDREASFAIRNPSPRVQRLVELVGLTDVWTTSTDS
jgi:anti-sigma B factor antagonist